MNNYYSHIKKAHNKDRDYKIVTYKSGEMRFFRLENGWEYEIARARMQTLEISNIDECDGDQIDLEFVDDYLTGIRAMIEIADRKF